MKRCIVWSQKERALLAKLWTTADIETCLESFPGRSERGIRQQAARMGLHRPFEQISKQRTIAGKKAMQLLHAKREQQRLERESLELLRRVFVVPASQAPAVNLSCVMSNPLEAAWRGAL